MKANWPKKYILRYLIFPLNILPPTIRIFVHFIALAYIVNDKFNVHGDVLLAKKEKIINFR